MKAKDLSEDDSKTFKKRTMLTKIFSFASSDVIPSTMSYGYMKATTISK